jgi:PD-(D/E)XK endonuclease
MAALKQKGDRAELEVARDLIRRGYRIAFPYGEDWDFDLIFARSGSQELERVQVKYTESKGAFIELKCHSHSLTNGRIRRTKQYTAETVDWMAAYDATTDRCYYVPAHELGSGKSCLVLRLTPPRNNQVARIRYAADYVDPTLPSQAQFEVEPAGFEPATS